MTKVSRYLWAYDISDDYDKVIFRADSSYGDTSKNQTGDLDVPESSSDLIVYQITGSDDSSLTSYNNRAGSWINTASQSFDSEGNETTDDTSYAYLLNYTISGSNAKITSLTTSNSSIALNISTVANGGLTINTVNDEAFKNNTAITSVKFGDKVTGIYKNAFDGCTNLTSVTFGSELQVLGDYAFYGCTSLASVDLSVCSSLTNLNAGAFQSCSKLTSAYLPKTLDYVENPEASDGTTVFPDATNLYIRITPGKKYTTFASCLNGYSLNLGSATSGLTAYTVTGMSGSDAVAATQYSGTAHRGDGLIMGVSTTEQNYDIPLSADESTDLISGNCMVGQTATDDIGNISNVYYLVDGTFYKAADGTNFEKGKAYLDLSSLNTTDTDGGAKILNLAFGDATAIQTIEAAGNGEEAWFTLAGQKVAKPSRGLYIRNGKKVMVK